MNQNKILILMLLLSCAIVFTTNNTFGATIVLNSCPYDSISSGNTYVLAPDFIWSMPSNYCFLLNKTLSNVIFDGNFTNFDASDLGNQKEIFSMTYSNYNSPITLDNILIQNFNISNPEFIMNITFINFDSTSSNITFNKLTIENNSISGITALITNRYTLIELSLNDFIIDELIIKNNFFQTQYGSFWNMGGISDLTGEGVVIINHITMINNDFENIIDQIQIGLISNLGGVNSPIFEIFTDGTIENNNFAYKYSTTGETLCGTYSLGGLTCGVALYIGGTLDYDNNFVGSLLPVSSITDINHDGLTDTKQTFQDSYGTTFFNDYSPTISSPKSTMNPEYSTKYYINRVWSYASFYQDQITYQLTQPLILNSTMYLNFEDVQFSTLDCSHLSTTYCFILTNVNQLKMGSNNILTGESSLRSNIYSSGVIDVGGFSIGSPFSTNYQLITYTNNFEMSNIKLYDQAVGEHGWIRKKTQESNGRLILDNNYFNLQRTPLDKTMPFIYFGFNTKIKDNIFQFNSLDLTTQTVFYGGISGASSLTGAHIITGNEFLSSGIMLNKIVEYGGNYTSGSLYPSQIYDNNFAGAYGFYSNPFSLAGNISEGRALMINPFLNYSKAIYTPNSCDAYYFNIGNYYEFWDDFGTLNDSNSDDISDIPLNVGYDFLGNFIIDYRPLMSYPYDFDDNLGFAEYYDMCKYFAFNVTSPIQNTTYNTSTVSSNWKFSSVYPNLWCYETLQDEDYLITDSGDSETNYGNVYNLTTGFYNWKLTCCKDYSCEGLKKESEPVYFCVNSCSPRGEVEDFESTILGCTNPTATNYDPLATSDDGSCTYPSGGTGLTNTSDGSFGVTFVSVEVGDLFSSDLETSKTAFGNLLKNVATVFILLFWISMVFVAIAILFIILYILYFGISIIYALFGGGRRG